MSLIDEALKRARLDAARQDAARQTLAEAPRGSGFASPWAHMPETRRRHPASAGRRQTLLAAVAGASLLIGFAGIGFFLRSPHGAAPTRAAEAGAPPAAAPSPSDAASPSDTASPSGAADGGQAEAPRSRRTAAARTAARAGDTPEKRRPPGAPTLPSTVAVARGARAPAGSDADPAAASSRLRHAGVPDGDRAAAARSAAAEPPAAALPPGAASESPTAPVAAPTAPTTAAPSALVAAPLAANLQGSPAGAAAPSAAAPAPAAAATAGSARVAIDGGTYVREVTLADGSAVKLSGIAFSDSPAAVINGKVLAPGQGVDSVTVDKIEADRVTLRDRSGILFYLRLN